MLRTSETDPLQIASVDVGAHRGTIGITFAPGKNDRSASRGPWARDLAKDLDVITALWSHGCAFPPSSSRCLQRGGGRREHWSARTQGRAGHRVPWSRSKEGVRSCNGCWHASARRHIRQTRRARRSHLRGPLSDLAAPRQK